jgi:hypothetical protein
MQRNTRWIGFYTAILLMSAIAGAAAATHGQNPKEAGQSSIYFYDLAASDSHGKGTLMIDVNKRTFVFNGQDFEPSMQIFLRARAAASDGYGIYAIGNTTPSGNLHLSGTWQGDAAVTEIVADISYPPIIGFGLSNTGGFVVQLACYYSTDAGATWQESAHIKGITLGMFVHGPLDALGVPEHASVKIHVEVVGGKDRTGAQVFNFDPDAYTYHWYADYEIHGTTWKPARDFEGCWRVI